MSSTYIVKSGAGYYLRFVHVPQMTTDPVKATRMPCWQAASVVLELDELGFEGEMVEVVLAKMRPEESLDDEEAV